MIETLQEYADARGAPLRVDRTRAVIQGVKILGLTSRNGRTYPCPRTNGDGAMVFPGHIGTIYQAHNGRYLGRGTARLLRLLPDGTVLNERTIAKARAGRTEKGWRCAVRLLVQHGAAWPLDDEDLAAWLRCWLPRLTRTVRHPGNHKYAWPLVRSARRILARGLGYPKAIERQVA